MLSQFGRDLSRGRPAAQSGQGETTRRIRRNGGSTCLTGCGQPTVTITLALLRWRFNKRRASERRAMRRNGTSLECDGGEDER